MYLLTCASAQVYKFRQVIHLSVLLKSASSSRDICNSFAVLNDLRHISSGGYIASGSRHRYSLILVTHTVIILKGVVMD